LRGVCRATKRNGESCRAPATEPDGCCWAHSPAHSAKRSRITSRAGRSKPSRELTAIKVRLSGLVDDVLAERVNKGAAAVAGQLLNAHLRALELERKWKELGEIEERIVALEQRQEGASAWGA